MFIMASKKKGMLPSDITCEVVFSKSEAQYTTCLALKYFRLGEILPQQLRENWHCIVPKIQKTHKKVTDIHRL